MLTIHGIPVSVHTRKVIVAAFEKRIRHRIQSVIPFKPPAGWFGIESDGENSRRQRRRHPIERRGGSRVLAGAEFSIADVALMSNPLNFHYLGLRIDAQYPHRQRYFRAHMARPSLQSAFAAETEAAGSLGLDRAAIAA